MNHSWHNYESESFPIVQNAFSQCKIKVSKKNETLILNWKQHLMKNLTWEIDSPRRLGMSRCQFWCKTPSVMPLWMIKWFSGFGPKWAPFQKIQLKSYILTARCVVRKYVCFHFRSQKVISFPTSYWAQGSNKPSRRTIHWIKKSYLWMPVIYYLLKEAGVVLKIFLKTKNDS